MGAIIAVEYTSLDGVFADPAWSGPYFDEELGRWQHANLFGADAMLLGRKTYEGFKAAWPTMTDEAGFADRMNALPKHVATTTLTEPEWNATFLHGDVADAVAKLKTEPGTLLINGSADLVNHLTAHGLIDEYRIMVFPVVVGSGRKLWDEGATASLKLTDSFVTGAGVAVLTYQPA